MLKHVKFVGIPVADQDAALKFWTEKMGLRVATDQPMGPGKRWIELAIPGAQTGITLFTPEGHETVSAPSSTALSPATMSNIPIASWSIVASSFFSHRRSSLGEPRRSSRIRKATHSCSPARARAASTGRVGCI